MQVADTKSKSIVAVCPCDLHTDLRTLMKTKSERKIKPDQKEMSPTGPTRIIEDRTLRCSYNIEDVQRTKKENMAQTSIISYHC